MRRTFNFLLLFFLSVMTAMAAPGDLQEKLAALKGISGIEKLQSDYYPEKYVVRITQQVDPKDPAAGTFTQRVIVGHVGYDRPTIIVTEGYGAAYALNPKYQEELSKLLNANLVFVEYRYFLESTPEPKNWDYLTAENSAYDLHNVRNTFKQIYPENGSVPVSAREDRLRCSTVPFSRMTWISPFRMSARYVKAWRMAVTSLSYAR